MKVWKVELTAGGRSLAETKIQSGIFQGDALSPLLFIITMMPLNHQLRKCTKYRTCKIVDFTVPADHRINLEESKKRDKYHDLVKELKNYGTWRWQ